MAGRSGPTFQKRQKEKARQERQREKFERRTTRKAEKASGIPSTNNTIDFNYNPYEGLDEYVFEGEEEQSESQPPAGDGR